MVPAGGEGRGGSAADRRRLATSVVCFVFAVTFLLTTGAAGAQTAAVDTSGQVSRITTDIDNVRALGLSGLLAVLTAVALVALPYALWRLAHATRTIQLVIDDVRDGTGDAVVKDRIGGLSQELREHVANELHYLTGQVGRTLARARLEGLRLSRQPLAPRSAPDATAKALAESLSGLASEPGRPVFAFLGQLLLRPRGTRVLTTLQRRGASPDRIGISFGIVDLRDEGAPEGKTLWEPAPAPLSRTRPVAPSTGRSPSGQPGDPSGARGAAELRAVAWELEEIGLLEEALSQLGDALTAARSSGGADEVAAAVHATSRVGAKLRIQSQARVSFGLAERLEQSARSDEAIDAYVEALPLSLHADARDLWALSMSSPPLQAAPCLLALAHFYRDHAYAWDEARTLLVRAEKLGLADALTERRRTTGLVAQSLARAAGSLLTLARYDGAGALAERCLSVDAANAAARAVQVAVIEALPPQGTLARETAAQLALARIHVKALRMDDAEREFTAALVASPDLAEAKTGLELVLSSMKSLDRRIAELLRPAVAVLALELLRRELTAEQARRSWYQVPPITALQTGLRRAREDVACRNEGLVRNYIGLLLQGYKGHPSLGLAFLDRSIEELRAAVTLIPDYYQPHENLADSYLFKAKKTRPSADPGLPGAADASIEMNVRLAIEQYRRGIQVLDTSALAGTPDGITARRIVLADLAIALMLPGATQDLARARTLLAEATDGWIPEAETHPRALLNLAAAIGRLVLAEGQPDAPLLALGRGLLAYALARDASREYWVVDDDPDFASLLADVDLEALRSALRSSDRCMYRMSAGAFADAVGQALRAATWPPVSFVCNLTGGPK